MINISKVNHMI